MVYLRQLAVGELQAVLQEHRARLVGRKAKSIIDMEQYSPSPES